MIDLECFLTTLHLEGGRARIMASAVRAALLSALRGCLFTSPAQGLNEDFMTDIINQVEIMSKGDSGYRRLLKDSTVKLCV